ncbi:choice-of-anchor D domain-containing protein [Flavobacterium sp.]|uniref:choice-of-anchor D domain-containing protein n=1 Tax=Flavobacterium sp. TaxID=239 RepID=UPI00122A4A09|nr:choice-of-anchor D domain-containing protein [Flavobacterium sp.]RZJ73313.1 MAG: choice-of-anchor D domain-containing protein [Flavobacterium sp.]
MKFKLLLLALGYLCLGEIAYAQSIWENPITGTNPSSTNPYTAGQTVDTNITVSGIGTSGVTVQTANDRYNTSGWNGAAINVARYFTFTLTPNSGSRINFVSFAYNGQASGTGPTSFAVRSSLDGYATNIGTAAVTGTNISLAAAAYQNITSAITFRVYAWGASAAGGTFSINDFIFNGTVINGFVTAQDGAWSTGATWVGGVAPTSAQNATVRHAVTDNVGITRNAGSFTTIDAGASLITSAGYTNNGSTTVDGTYIAASATTISTGSTFRINGTLQMNTGGTFATNAPVYGNASTLNYASGGNFGRGLEWSAIGVGTIGTTAGYPNNISLSNNTTLNYINGTSGSVGNKALAGDLTIATGSTFAMNFGGLSPGGFLTVNGNVLFSGTLALGPNATDDLKLGNNFTVNTGTFTHNNRRVFFVKNGVQQISTTNLLTIPYVVYQPVTGSTTITLIGPNNLIVSAPVGGNAITFNSTADVFSLNGLGLTIGTAGVANTISGGGTFSGTATSNLTLLGTGSIGTLSFTTGGQSLNNFTINRTANATAATLGTPLSVVGTLALTAGRLDVGNFPLTIGAAGAITATTDYVIADRSAGANAALRKVFTANPAGYVFRVGDNNASADGSQYSPATVTTTGATYAANAYISVAVNDIEHPNYEASTDYISRYWDISANGVTGITTFTASGTYTDADVVGNEANYTGNRYSGTAWSDPGTGVNAATNVIAPVPGFVSGATHALTAGRRDPDINIKQAATNYLHNSTYAFGTQLVGSTTDITFTIENLGQQDLTFSAATVTNTTGTGFGFNPAFVLTPSIPGPTGTRTFVIRFAPGAVGAFAGNVSFTTNDPSGNENPYVINFTGNAITPVPEINIKGFTGGTNNIVSGATTANSLNNTQFAATNIGATTAPKDYEIQNLGTAVLNLTGTPIVTLAGANPGDFAVSTQPSTNAVAVGTSTVFYITFSPTAVGVRTAIVSIANNDSDENPYTFLIQGTGVCTAATNVITPATGPAGTVVTITASVNNLTGATVTFSGIPAVVTQISATQITAVVPVGAISGNIVTTNASGCQGSNPFTVIDTHTVGCEGTSGAIPGDLFISEVTDATTGGVSYVEIFNGTGSTVNLTDYQVRVHSDGSMGAPVTNVTLIGTLSPLSTYTLAIGVNGSPNATNTCLTPGGNGQFANQTSGAGGINFDTGGNDYIGLYRISLGSFVDSFGIFGSATWADGLGLGDRGAAFRRKNNVTVPKYNYTNADWDITDWAGQAQASCSTNDYSDIGTFNFLSGTPPTITLQPTFTPSCKETAFTVAATEGYAGGNALAYQWYVAAPGAANWTALTNSGVYSGVTTTTLSVSSITGLTGYQYYAQVRENGASCYTASHAVMITGVQTVTWNGTAWSPTAPNSTTPAIINGNYNTAANGSFEACSLTVNGSRTLVISPNTYVSIVNDLSVLAAGTLQVQNSGSLVMIDNNGIVTNNGTTQVFRTTTPFRKYDYTYWSSPVANTTLGAAMPGWRFDYSWTFNTANYSDVTGPNGTGPADGFDDNNDTWIHAGAGATMIPGKCYVVMTPTNLGTYPATATATFSGAVNNGIISFPISLSANPADNGDDYNLVGNPYPSALFADPFINLNTNISGTLLFWTHSTPVSNTAPGPYQSNFVTTDYAMYNLSGGVASSNGGAQPTGYIASGQGFFVEAEASGNLVFNNGMRDKGFSNNNFYRNTNTLAQTAPAQKDRVWLNFQHPIGLFSQVLFYYTDDATLGVDRGYDGVVANAGNSVSLYSFIDSDKYRIQGRPAFSTTDVIPLGVNTALPGTYTISIEHAEGILNDASVPIYLEDKLLNVFHNLKQGPYSFDLGLGTVDNRFQLRYAENALGNPDIETPINQIQVVSTGNSVMVRSVGENISEVEIFDLLGRSIIVRKNVNQTDIEVPLNIQEQALLVKVKLIDGTSISRKIVH